MPLKEKIVERMQQEAGEWTYLEQLPQELHGLHFQKLYRENDDMYELFSYTNEERHLGFCAYFHQETEEYKARIRIGLTEFCLMQFIAGDFTAFQQQLEKYMDKALGKLTEYNPDNISYITKALNITQWDYKDFLPPTLQGFQLFITPAMPVPVLNGSYIVLDYSDFSIESNFIIYYNEFRCEFFGESRIRNIPEMKYDFDAKTLAELEKNLREKLEDKLIGIRCRAAQETD